MNGQETVHHAWMHVCTVYVCTVGVGNKNYLEAFLLYPVTISHIHSDPQNELLWSISLKKKKKHIDVFALKEVDRSSYIVVCAVCLLSISATVWSLFHNMTAIRTNALLTL